jgi:hypothetical protein
MTSTVGKKCRYARRSWCLPATSTGPGELTRPSRRPRCYAARKAAEILSGHQRIDDGQEDGDTDGSAHLREESGGRCRHPDVRGETAFCMASTIVRRFRPSQASTTNIARLMYGRPHDGRADGCVRGDGVLLPATTRCMTSPGTSSLPSTGSSASMRATSDGRRLPPCAREACAADQPVITRRQISMMVALARSRSPSGEEAAR